MDADHAAARHGEDWLSVFAPWEWEGRQLLPIGWANVLKHATVNMHASFDPGLRYANFFWVFGEHQVYMAVGWHGQLSAAFPDLDAVAVVTAHKFVRFGDVIRGVSAAVKSESALPPNPNDDERLANAIKDGAVEKNRPPLVLHPRLLPLYRERPINFLTMRWG